MVHCFQEEQFTQSYTSLKAEEDQYEGYMFKYALEDTSSTSKLFNTTLDKLLSTTSTLAIETYTEELSSLFEELSWAREFFASSSSISTVKELVPYYKEFQSLLLSKKYDEFDRILEHVKTESLTNVLLVGLLRLTYSERENIPSWQLLREKAQKELDRRSLDGSAILKGI